MAAESTIHQNRVNVYLNDGSNYGSLVCPFGGTLKNTAFDSNDQTNVLNIAVALESCLSKEIYSIEHVQTARITAA